MVPFASLASHSNAVVRDKDCQSLLIAAEDVHSSSVLSLVSMFWGMDDQSTSVRIYSECDMSTLMKGRK